MRFATGQTYLKIFMLVEHFMPPKEMSNLKTQVIDLAFRSRWRWKLAIKNWWLIFLQVEMLYLMSYSIYHVQCNLDLWNLYIKIDKMQIRAVTQLRRNGARQAQAFDSIVRYVLSFLKGNIMNTVFFFYRKIGLYYTFLYHAM